MRRVVLLQVLILILGNSSAFAGPKPGVTPLPDSGIIPIEFPIIRWLPDSVQSVTLLQGTSSRVSAEITAVKPQRALRLAPSEELMGLVVVEPESLLAMSPGDTVSVICDIASHATALPGIRNGRIKLVSLVSGVEVSHLNVSVEIRQPTSEFLPDDISVPTGDRIVTDPLLGILRLKDELLVRFIPTALQSDISSFLNSKDGVFQGFDADLDVYQIRFPNLQPEMLPGILDDFNSDPIVDFAVYHLLSKNVNATIPDDPMFDDWDEGNPAGNNYPQELIRLPSAWDISIGSQGVRVAVIDHGFDIEHPDLKENIVAYDFVPGDKISGNPHGTHVAGIIGALGNNDEGIAGAAWQCGLMFYNVSFEPIDFDFLGLPHRGDRVGSWLWMWKFMKQAVDDGAQIVSMSLGIDWQGRIPSTPADEAQAGRYNDMLAHAVDYARDAGKEVLWVFSAGNDGVDAKFNSPAGLAARYDNAIAVAAVGQSANLSVYSNRGTIVEIAAPGDDVLSTVPQNLLLHADCYEPFPPCPPLCSGLGRYTCKTGTSMAAPFVAGVGALVLSQDPTLSASELKHRIIRGSELGGLAVNGQSFFVLNAYESLNLEQEVIDCPGNAIQFDGNDDFVQISDASGDLSFGSSDQMTVELWFNLSEPRANYDLASKRPTCATDYNYQLHVGAGRLTFLNQSFKVEATFAATVGEWYHVAATCNGSQSKLYVNGDLKACAPGGLGNHVNNYEVTLGRAGGCELSTPFVGTMDEVRIWNVARTDLQVGANFSRTVDLNTPGLVGYWNFDEASGQVIDRSVQQNDGTLLNGAHRVVSTAPTCNTSTPLPGVFEFTSGPQTWVVPSGVTSILVDARGAAGGGRGTLGPNDENDGGRGGRVQTTLAVTPGETLVIYVGGRGGSLCSPNTGGQGGFNGGGAGGIDNVDYNGPAYGGGGASDIRQGGASLAHRVVVAAGGGGAECCTQGVNGGDGGGTVGLAGGTYFTSGPGGGGTLAAGGAGGGGCNGNGSSGGLGQGGQGGNGNRAGGGGGGGYYGGGGGGGCTYGSGGGGGSSYSAGTSITHTSGFQTGNGQVVITPAPVAGYTGDELTSGELNKSMAQQSSASITAPTNYPNPFNAGTVISYTLAEPGPVMVEVFNVLGQSVRILADEVQMPGAHSLHWDGRDNRGASLASGVYFYRLSMPSSSQVKKMVIVK